MESSRHWDICLRFGRAGAKFVSHGEFVAPCDVVKVWKEVKTEKFQAYHKRASWVWKCLYCAEEMYAVTPIEIMLEVINVKKGMRMKQADKEYYIPTTDEVEELHENAG